jgi:TolB protein
MRFKPTLFSTLIATIICLNVTDRVIGQQELEIVKAAEAKAIPIQISGFTGEVDAVLKFDLYIAGFTNVPSSQAQFLISGSNSGNLQGMITDQISKAVRLSKSYSGGTSRSQAHLFSDDIVLALTGQRGIAMTKIAFKGEISKRVSEIFVADYDGMNAVQITRDNSLVAAPAWGAGPMIFYTSYMKGFPDVYSHDLATGSRRAVANYSGLNTSAAISPDGRRVALILSKSGSPDLFVCDADGSNLRQLTKTPEDESSPTWSPDGRTICFVSRAGGQPALYTIPAEGGSMRKITTRGVAMATEPAWSPDGRQIAFTTLRRGGFEILLVPPQGGEATFLVGGEDPSWAPNSRTLIFTRRVNHKRVLSLLDVPTKHVKDVHQTLGNCSQPSWAK